MAYTQEHLDRIKNALASGALTVETNDGKRVTYRNIDELLMAKREVEAELAKSSGQSSNRVTYATYSKD